MKHNAETGDNVAPAVIKSGLPAEARKTEYATEIDPAELAKGGSGRVNNYGVKSNMPPDNPSKRADMFDVEDIKVGPPSAAFFVSPAPYGCCSAEGHHRLCSITPS